MRCYYEVLCIEQNADNDSIKKAYYRLSLKHHPDKNVGREDEVTALYQEIQEAYRVLSDSHERAWYDKHRDRILQGGMGGAGSDFKEVRLDVYQYFTTSCYHGMTDETEGYFGVYNKVFKEIREEELQSTVTPDGNFEKIFPDFGWSESNYDEIVRPFYANWEAFNSQKTYAWVETLDSRSAPSRRIRRAMEADNKKLRDTARRERNDEVRALVAFVKKRDPRVIAERQRLQKESELKRNQSLEAAKLARARNREQLEEETAVWQANQDQAAILAMERELARLEAHWDDAEDDTDNDNRQCKKDNGEVNGEEKGHNSNEGSSEDEFDGFYCPVCNKAFQSEKSYENHLNSKKHKKQVAVVREQLLAEDPSLQVDELLKFTDGNKNDGDNDSLNNGDDGDQQKPKSKRAKRNKRREKRNAQKDENSSDDDNDNPPKENASAEVDCDEKTINLDTNSKQTPNVKANQEIFICKICTEKFDTRNKLFTHIKDSGHAALKAPDVAPSMKQKKSKNKKNK